MTIKQWLNENGYANVEDANGFSNAEFVSAFVTPTDQWHCGNQLVRVFFKTTDSAHSRFQPVLVVNGDHFQMLLSS